MSKEYRRVTHQGNELNYEIDDSGNIRNYTTKVPIKCHLDRGGYVKANIIDKELGIHKCMSVHRLVMLAFVPNPDNLPEVNHIDGNKQNNHISNLEWCDRLHNIRHAIATGLKPVVCVKGESNWNNRYSEEQIKHVMDLMLEGKYSYREIAKLTGVKRATIKKIGQKKEWKHLLEGYDFDNRTQRQISDHSKLYNSLDRAILANVPRKAIIDTLMEYGMTVGSANGIYYLRKKRIKDGKTMVNFMGYIDEGIEIF